MKKFITLIIISFLFSGCWVLVEPVPTHSIVVEYCDYELEYFPRSDYPTYCEGSCCVWQDEYSHYWCEEVWCEAYNYCGWELVENGCYDYY